MMIGGLGTCRWKILIVACDSASAEACLRVANAIGHWGYAVASASEAMGLWTDHGHEFDLVICDVTLADMRGTKLEHRLRQRQPNLRMLFIGSAADSGPVDGSSVVLSRPFTPGGLRQAIEQVMNRV